jgi:hypothetical protein
MNANVAHAELARAFDKRCANLGAVEFEAAAFRALLRVALAIDGILHELEWGHFWASIRHHHGVEKEPVSALNPVN